MTPVARRSFRSGFLALLATLLGLAAMSASAHAAAGALDPSFSGDGLTTLSFGPSSDEASAVALQRDGKSVHVGCSQVGANCTVPNATGPVTARFALTRYNRDGSLDTSFGTGGKVLTDLTARYANLRAVAIQPDGKIVVAGGIRLGTTTTRNDFVVARYTSRGNLDTSFGGGDGVTITPIGPFYDQANGLALLPHGKILLAGTSDQAPPSASQSDDDFALAQYNADGTPDTTFSGDGQLTTAFGSQDDGAGSVILTRAGKYVAAGESKTAAGVDFAIARYNADGALDSTFSADGRQTTSFGVTGDDHGSSVREQSDGKLVVSGDTNAGGPTGEDYGLVRYLSNGSLDPTFGNGGKVTTSFNNGNNLDSANDLQLQPDGKIVAAGDSILPGSVLDFTVARYDANGSLDSTFGVHGRASAAFSGASADFGFALALQPDGRILISGYTSAGSTGFDFAAARFRGDQADLRAGLSDRPDPATRGRTVLYTASARNLGPEAARNATLNMALPSRARLLSAKPSQGHCFRTSGKNLRCEFGRIGSGSIARVSVRVRPIHRPRIRSRIVVASETLDTAPGNNRASSSTRIVAPRR